MWGEVRTFPPGLAYLLCWPGDTEFGEMEPRNMGSAPLMLRLGTWRGACGQGAQDVVLPEVGFWVELAECGHCPCCPLLKTGRRLRAQYGLDRARPGLPWSVLGGSEVQERLVSPLPLLPQGPQLTAKLWKKGGLSHASGGNWSFLCVFSVAVSRCAVLFLICIVWLLVFVLDER